MEAESFKKQIATYLKSHGFKKYGATWRRSQPESIAVFNVQKSGWGGGTYYVNVGAYFRALGNEEAPPSNRCHVQTRIELGEPSVVAQLALAWFQERASLQRARELAESDSMRGLVFKELRTGAA
jgi:hypothetical protein